MTILTLDLLKTALLIVDVQEKLYASVDRSYELLSSLHKIVRGCQILEIPVFVSEQYPQGLGATITQLKSLLGDDYHPYIKSTFSCLEDPNFFSLVQSLFYTQWLVVGLEAHICVLQTAKGLLNLGKEVVVLNDAVTSCTAHDYATAMAEMRDLGIRVSSVETVLFELLKDSKHPKFKEISHLVKTFKNPSSL